MLSNAIRKGEKTRINFSLNPHIIVKVLPIEFAATSTVMCAVANLVGEREELRKAKHVFCKNIYVNVSICFPRR